MKAQVITHDEVLEPTPGKSFNTKLPVDVTYGEIYLWVTGGYTISTDTLHPDFPKNVLREVRLKRNSDDGIYSGESKDIRVSNYYDQLGLEHFTAASGLFEALFKLNKAVILSDPNVLPAGHDHPFKKITQLDLVGVAGNEDEAFDPAGTGTGTLDSVKIEVIYEQMRTSEAEVRRIYGDRLERYAFPKVSTKQTGSLATGSELAEILNIGSSHLHKRAFMTTKTDATPAVESNDRIEKYQIKQKLPVAEAKDLISSPFQAARAADKVYYGLQAILDGVVAFDYDAEVSQDGKGILVPEKEEALKLLAKVDNAAKIRYLSEEYLVHREHVAQGGALVFGTFV